ncbi:uncharacterized protein LOC130429971 [Triplophysa dalaica]|uniref:uncharacterized protein LOC130429971 n=1 Tax=Triplophysa dalaica TaxID=1582913 RepID=UPI0024DFEB14|nr:uncharacterized protein LOC130429971 [Triplophysa dalaica]
METAHNLYHQLPLFTKMTAININMKNCFMFVFLVCGVFGDPDEVKIVLEGDSVTLHTNLTDIQINDEIRWRFGPDGSASLLVHIDQNVPTYKDSADGTFTDRLQISNIKTGDLTIKNMRIKHSGLYKAQIVRPTGVTQRKFNIEVYGVPHLTDPSAGESKTVLKTEGESVTLDTGVQTQTDDLILWRFGDVGVLLAKADKDDNKTSINDADDGRFRGRLKLDDQTGSLIISDVQISDSGEYKLKISSNFKKTLYKRFIVSVSERRQTPGENGGIAFVVLLAAAVVAVFSFRRYNYEQQKRKVKEKIVPKGDSVTLETDVTEPQSDDVIEWIFRDEVIATFNKSNSDEERFIDRLKMDNQAGSLTITNIRTEDAGLYKVKISSSSRLKSFLQFITGEGPSYRQFNVIVTDTVGKVENNSVTLNTDVTELKSDDVIQWRFGETLIAEINRKINKFSTDDEIFRDRLNLNDKTGDLTIRDLNTEHTGHYKLKIINSRGTSFTQTEVNVMEGLRSVKLADSVSLGIDVAGIQNDDVIQWTLGDEETPIAEITGLNKLSYDKRFKERLELDPKTGDLTISNITSELSGVYRAKIISSRGTTYRTYRVNISVIAYKGESLTLHTDSKIQSGSEIKWIYDKITCLVTGKNGDDSETKYKDDVRFKDRLKMNHETGDLTITDVIATDAGVYKLQIKSKEKISFRIFSVFFKDNTDEKEQDEQKSVCKYENDSVTLNADVTEPQSDDMIQWRFGETLIAEINRNNNKISIHHDVLDGRFRDRLKLNDKTGDLTIRDLNTEHTGHYKLKIINSRGTSYSQFKVYVRENVRSVVLGHPVTLYTDVTGIQRGDVIQWTLETNIKTPIAQMTVGTELSYDGRWRSRMKLDPQTGHLTISNITAELSGVFRAKIISRRGTEYRTYRVNISVNAYEGESLAIHTDSKIQRGSEIKWISEDNIILVTGKIGDYIETKYTDNVRFKDRLKMNHETGDLTITKIRKTDDGVYKLQISSDDKISYKMINVFVNDGPSPDQKQNSVCKYENDSVTLNTDVTELKSDDVIQWRFGETLLAEINRKNYKFTTDDEIFRDRLKLNDKTGDLTIRDLNTEHTGHYKLKIINSRGTSYSQFKVYVRENIRSVEFGHSVILYTDVTGIQRDDVIQWTFGDEKTPIAEITGLNNKLSYDERFTDKLELNTKTGHLTISSITTQLSGVYRAKIISSRGTEYRTYRVVVSVIAYEGESLTIHTDSKIQRGSEIKWISEDNISLVTGKIGVIRGTKYTDNVRFKDRLNMNHETGDLTITKIRKTDDGVYKLQIRSDDKISYKMINVFVNDGPSPDQKQNSVCKYENDSVTLNTDVTELKSDDVIQWRFGETLIAEINRKNNKFTTDDEIFRDRLKLNDKTGDLTIRDLNTEHTGHYKLKIINSRGTSYSQFKVYVRENVRSVEFGNSVILYSDVTGIQKDDKIQWTFGDEKPPIAEITVGTEPSYDKRFKERLKLNPETGDLTISNITSELSGVYRAKIISSSRGTEYRTYRVVVSVIAYEGESLTIHTDSKIQRGSEIKWISEDNISLVTGKIGVIRDTKLTDNERFKDRLNMNHETGDLTITKIRKTDDGVYKLQISSDDKISYKMINVFVNDGPSPDQKQNSVCKYENDSVTLNTDVTELKSDDVIQWRFGETLIAEINRKNNKFTTDDEIFRDRLKLNDKTGDLTIRDLNTEHTGHYKLKIINSRGTSYSQIKVYVRENIRSVEFGHSVILYTDVTVIQRDDVIQWTFEDEKTPIAEITGLNKLSYDKRFKERLELNPKTGHLTITNITSEVSGVYGAKIISSSRGTEYRTYRVVVSVNAYEGESLTIHTDSKIQRGSEIKWISEDNISLVTGKIGVIKDTKLTDNVRFKDRLKMNHETGDLTITKIRKTDDGVYKLQISSDDKISYKMINVFVNDGPSPDQKQNSVCKYENNSVTLNTDVTELKSDDVIQWRFGETLIAEINRKINKISTDDEIFRDRLKLNDKTGDLTIRDLNTEHTGHYKLKIINSRGTSYSQFKVYVRENIRSVEFGHSVILYSDVTGIQRDDVIQWTFEDEKPPIAEITGLNKLSYDERFTERLELNPQTGDLTITNITSELSGVYRAKIISSSRGTEYRTYRVNISVNACEGESLTILTDSKIQRDSEIKWISENNIILATIMNGVIIDTKYTDDERFKDRLKMNPQTGDLTITDVRWTDAGVYKLHIKSKEKISFRIFMVWIKNKASGKVKDKQKSESAEIEENKSAAVDKPSPNEVANE